MGAGGANLSCRAISYRLSILAKPMSPTHLGWVNDSQWLTWTSHEAALQSCGALANQTFSGACLVLLTGLLPFLWKLQAEHTPRWSLLSGWQRRELGRIAALTWLQCVCFSRTSVPLWSFLRSQVQLLCASLQFYLFLPLEAQGNLSSLFCCPWELSRLKPGLMSVLLPSCPFSVAIAWSERAVLLSFAELLYKCCQNLWPCGDPGGTVGTAGLAFFFSCSAPCPTKEFFFASAESENFRVSCLTCVEATNALPQVCA